MLKHNYTNLAIISIACSLFSGCSSQQLYATGQAYQRNQCQQLLDQNERDNCLSKTNTSYEDYKQDTDTTNK